MKPFEVIDGTKGKGTPGFVCTFCATSFATRAELDQHWDTDSRCKNNRFASNATQTKYGDADAVPTVHGEEALRKVRAPTCAHPPDLRRILADEENRPIGWRCIYCYSDFTDLQAMKEVLGLVEPSEE